MSQQPKIKMVEIPTADLIPNPRNAKQHDDTQVAKIAGSIREFGFGAPIITDGDNGILAGHGRWLAAQKLGLEKVPCVEMGHLSDTQRRAYMLADNRLAEIGGGWDMDMLKIELEELAAEEIDLDALGFGDDFEIDLDGDEGAEGGTDPDDVPEPPADPVTALGDIWLLGRHRLMCGDSTSIDAVDKLMDGAIPNAIITDPPYGIGIDGQKKSVSANPKHNRKHHEKKGWDSERPNASIFAYIVALGVPTVIWGGNYFADLLPATRGWLYWSKGQDGLTMSDGELAWTTENKPLRSKTVNRAALKGSVHPTQKPAEVIEFSIDYLSVPQKGAVLDLFSGSGTLCVVCEKTDRRAFMMDRDEGYCDVAIKRWQDFTGQQATHEASGKTFDKLKAAK